MRPPRREHKHVPGGEHSLPRAGGRRERAVRERHFSRGGARVRSDVAGPFVRTIVPPPSLLPRPSRKRLVRGGGVTVREVGVQAHRAPAPQRVPIRVERGARQRGGRVQEHAFQPVRLREHGDARVVVQRGRRASLAQPKTRRLRLAPTRGVAQGPEGCFARGCFVRVVRVAVVRI